MQVYQKALQKLHAILELEEVCPKIEVDVEAAQGKLLC